jgi:threonine/homoserine/homoserine lactone efflux protein
VRSMIIGPRFLSVLAICISGRLSSSFSVCLMVCLSMGCVYGMVWCGLSILLSSVTAFFKFMRYFCRSGCCRAVSGLMGVNGVFA